MKMSQRFLKLIFLAGEILDLCRLVPLSLMPRGFRAGSSLANVNILILINILFTHAHSSRTILIMNFAKLHHAKLTG